MTLTTTSMRVLLHLVTRQIQQHRDTMQTHHHHKDRTILRPPVVHTHHTRAILLHRQFHTRVTCSFHILYIIIFSIVKHSTRSIFFFSYYTCMMYYCYRCCTILWISKPLFQSCGHKTKQHQITIQCLYKQYTMQYNTV